MRRHDGGEVIERCRWNVIDAEAENERDEWRGEKADERRCIRETSVKCVCHESVYVVMMMSCDE